MADTEVTVQTEVTTVIVELNDETTLAVLQQPTIEDVTLTITTEQGPAGPPGPQGGSGSGGTFQEDDFTVDNSISYSYTLSSTPISGTISVFLNGLRENKNNFSISGTLLTINGAVVLTPTDSVTVWYTR